MVIGVTVGDNDRAERPAIRTRTSSRAARPSRTSGRCWTRRRRFRST